MKEFNIICNYETVKVRHQNIEFPDCETIAEVRSWLNGDNDLIDIGNQIHNIRNVLWIDIEEAEVR